MSMGMCGPETDEKIERTKRRLEPSEFRAPLIVSSIVVALSTTVKIGATGPSATLETSDRVLFFRMEIVLAFAIVAGLLWGTLYAARGSLLVGCLCFLLSICVGHQIGGLDAGAFSLTIDRLILIGLVGCYLARRRLGRTFCRPLARTDWFWFALLAVLTASSLASGGGPTLKGDTPASWRLMAGYLAPFVIYWIASHVPPDERSFRTCHLGLAGFGVYLAFTGVCEVFRLWGLVYPTFIANPKLGLHFGRARGPMVQSISYGHYLDVGMLSAWVASVPARRSVRLAFIVLLPLFLAGIYFSYTRSVWIGAVLAIMAGLAFTLRGAWRPLALASVILPAAILLATKLDSIMGFQREGKVADTKSSADVRASFAYVSWQMFLDRPLLGHGFGRFPIAKLPYLSDRSTDLQLELMRPLVHHNYFLSLLTETGAVGLAIFLGLVVSIGVTSWRLARRRDFRRWHGILTLGALGVYLAQASFHELSYTSIDNSLIALLAGMAVGASREADLAASDG